MARLKMETLKQREEEWINMTGMTKTALPQFNRERHGSLYDRGTADAWYHRKPKPHWYPEGTYNGKRIEVLNESEIEEYMEGYNYYMDNGWHKEWD